MLNKRGGSEADLTVSRLEAGAANLPLAPEANGKEESGMGISFISILIYYVFDRDIAHVSLIIICDLLNTCDLISGKIYHLAECVCVIPAEMEPTTLALPVLLSHQLNLTGPIHIL